MSHIARRADVGQAVLYRHFPRRIDLAFEVFDANFTYMERILDSGSSSALFELWHAMLGFAVTDTAFVDVLLASRTEVGEYGGAARMAELLDETRGRAQRAGLCSETLKTEHLLQAWRMAYGMVITAESGAISAADLQRIFSIESVQRFYSLH